MSLMYSMKNQRPIKELKILSQTFNNLKMSSPAGKFLTLVACHTNSKLKLNSTIQNLKRLIITGNKVIVINSVDSEFNDRLKSFVQKTYPAIEYIEVPNNSHLDAGKWMTYMRSDAFHKIKGSFNYVVFTNDSYLLSGPVDHFYKGALNSSKDMFGFTSSSQERYHYQSYMFAIRPQAVGLFVNHYHKVGRYLIDYHSVVGNIEMQLEKIYLHSCSVLIDLGLFPGNTGRNIFFNNDTLYTKLRTMGILPITKIKRITEPQSNHGRKNPSMTTEIRSMYSPTQVAVKNPSAVVIKHKNTSNTSFPTGMKMSNVIVGTHQAY